jgi:hypothetical protein
MNSASAQFIAKKERLLDRLTEIRDDRPTGYELAVANRLLSKRDRDAVTLSELDEAAEVCQNRF